MNKTLLIVLLACSTAACATTGALQGNSGIGATTPDAAPASISGVPSLPDPDTTTPRIIIPVTGGAPVVGIPLGGDLYLPVTGGAPVVGISTGP